MPTVLPMTDDPCPECGAAVAGGQAACHRAFDRLTARSLSSSAYARGHRLVVDSFCMQHVLPYARSAKSYAAHLAGLCCGIEHGGDIQTHAALQRWLSGSIPRGVDRPSPPVARGAMTVHDVAAVARSAQYLTTVEAWGRLVWDAYAEQQEMARQWVALAQRASGARR